MVQLVALDHDIVKRLFKVSNSNLPAMYNPNTNSGTKYRVPAKLEEQKEIDDNFEFIGTIETVKKSRSSGKRSSDEANGGAGSSRSDAKRPANGSSAAEGTHPEYEDDTVRICGNPTLMKVFTSKEFATSFAELRCREDQSFTVCKAGPGKFILLLGPV